MLNDIQQMSCQIIDLGLKYILRILYVRDRETWLLLEKGVGIDTFSFQDHM